VHFVALRWVNLIQFKISQSLAGRSITEKQNDKRKMCLDGPDQSAFIYKEIEKYLTSNTGLL
jgi:hypothetical protein